MTEIVFFLKGMIAGFVVAAPIGPIGILCVNRTLSGGRKSGFVSGLGAVTGDGFYAVVAAYSITVVSSFLNDHRSMMRIGGGIFLSYLAFRIFRAKPEIIKEKKITGTYLEDYVSAVGLTMTNPVTVVVFAAMFASFGLGAGQSGYWTPALMAAGVITGSTLCWFFLSGIVSRLRDRVSGHALRKINMFAGGMILAFALIVFLSAGTK